MKRRTKLTTVMLAGLAGCLGCWIYVSMHRKPSPTTVTPVQSPTKPAPLLSTGTNRGQQLAQTYCTACHLLPDPSLLDKSTWQNGALPNMMPWLGLAPPEADRPDGQILREANIFPPSPIISESDWRVIIDYYLESAPIKPLPQSAKPSVHPELKQFRVKQLPYQRKVPMTTLVKIDPEHQRLFVGDAMTRTLEALDKSGERAFTVEFDSGPISLRINNSSLDLTLIGRLSPSDENKGKLLRLRPMPDDMQISKILGTLRRPTDTAFADLNGDGREDFIVCQFGNRLGRVSWFENLPGGQFEEHLLAERPGAIRAEVYDVNKDGRPDIFVLMAQAREGLYLFLNQGHGNFSETTLIAQHPLFGFTWFELLDFNQDGFIDILTTNGDNGEYVSPHKNYHGVHLYLNDGRNHFFEKWFFPLNGAYKAVAADFDGDGDLDIAAISFFPDYEKSPDESFVYLENRGGLVFEPYTFPESTTGRWVTMDVGDVDGDGDLDIILGSLILGPTTIPIPLSVQARWKSNAPAILMLENLRH